VLFGQSGQRSVQKVSVHERVPVIVAAGQTVYQAFMVRQNNLPFFFRF
jgi:hypothetical protein